MTIGLSLLVLPLETTSLLVQNRQLSCDFALRHARLCFDLQTKESTLPVDSLLSLLFTDTVTEVLLLLLKRCCPVNASPLLRSCSAKCHGSSTVGCGGLNAGPWRQVMQRVHVRALLLLHCTHHRWVPTNHAK